MFGNQRVSKSFETYLVETPPLKKHKSISQRQQQQHILDQEIRQLQLDREALEKEKSEWNKKMSERVTCSMTTNQCGRQFESTIEYGTNCLQCGHFICSSCVIKLLARNGHNKFSIGYQCPGCAFFNCNKTVIFHGFKNTTPSTSKSLRSRIVRDNALFASGISTTNNPHPNGKFLHTLKSSKGLNNTTSLKQENDTNLFVEIIEEDEEAKENSAFRFIVSDNQ